MDTPSASEATRDPLGLDYDGMSAQARVANLLLDDTGAPTPGQPAGGPAETPAVDSKMLEIPAKILHRVAFSVLATALKDCGVKLSPEEEEAMGVAFAPVLAEWDYARKMMTPVGVYLMVAGPIALGKISEHAVRVREAKRAADSTDSNGATAATEEEFSFVATPAAARQPNFSNGANHASA